MSMEIYLGEPPAAIKEWIIKHYTPQPTPGGNNKMIVVYADGSEEEVVVESTITKSGFPSLIGGSMGDIESLTFQSKVVLADEAIFENCSKLAEVIFDGKTVEDIANKVETWSIGLEEDGTTHLVVIYCDDGVIVVNDADGSSGEMGIKLDWDKFSTLLETYHTSGTDPLPVGTSILIPYKVDPNGEAVDTEWIILGYNKSIPQYVKYKNGDERIYVTTIKDGLLTAIGNGTKVFTESDGVYTEVGTVGGIGSGTITYGNNNSFSVPDSVTYGGKTYEFAGSNATIMSKYGLVAKYNGELYCYPQFRSYEKTSQYRNDWSDSEMREWMNGSSDVPNQKWYTNTWSSTTTGTIVGLMGRLTDEKFMKHVSPCVNRTWVHDSWTSGKTLDSNQCEHVVDKFWLLDVAAVNCKGGNTTSYFPDGGATVDGDSKGYGTSRYSDIFNETDIWTPEKTRWMKMMKEDGSAGSACGWWLRSALSSYDYSVGYVDDAGGVGSNGASGNYACLPVCLIQ